MVRILSVVGVALAANTLWVLAAPVTRDSSVYGGKPSNHFLIRRTEEASKQKGAIQSEAVDNSVDGWPSSGLYPEVKWCPFGNKCTKFGGWVQAVSLKNHMVKFHGGQKPPGSTWDPGPVFKQDPNPASYIVMDHKPGEPLHEPGKAKSATYNPPLPCPVGCHAKGRTKKPLTWSRSSQLENHINKVHNKQTSITFNYPNNLRADNERVKMVNQIVKQFRKGSNPTSTTGTTGGHIQEPTTRGQKRKPFFLDHINIPRKSRTATECIGNHPTQPVGQPSPIFPLAIPRKTGTPIESSSRQDSCSPQPTCQPTSPPTSSGFTDPGSPRSVHDSSGAKASSSPSSHQPS